MRAALDRWVRYSVILGLGLVLASILLPMQATFPEYKRANVPPLRYAGAVMTVLGIPALWKRSQVPRLGLGDWDALLTKYYTHVALVSKETPATT